MRLLVCLFIALLALPSANWAGDGKIALGETSATNSTATNDFVSVSTTPAAEGPAMLPIIGKHARSSSSGWQFTEYACGYPNGCVYHPGWDFNLSVPNDQGQNVYAIADGNVILDASQVVNGVATSWGVLLIEHNVNGQHFYSQYGHVKEVYVTNGQRVSKGNRIAKVGDVGATGAFHLHWEIRTTSHGNPIDPDYWNDNLKNYSTVTSWYRNPERMIVRLDIDAERIAQGEGNYGNLVQDNDWFIPLNADAPYNGDNTPKTCYVQKWSGGAFGPCGIIFDALGGTRTAYTVRNGFWGTWNTAGGPSSPIGIPVTNEYGQGGSTSRQDFQKGYLYWNGSSVSVNYYPNCAPGWTGSGWNNQYSYLFARAYERNGSRYTLGEATGVVYTWNGFQRQDFAAGKCIMYDPNNAVGNPAATNEAYYLAGNFYTVYFNEYPSAWQAVGPPTRDREGNTQYFKHGRMVEEANNVVRVYNASNHQIWTNYVGGSGGGSTPLTYMTGPAPAAEIAAMISSRMTTPLNNKNPYGFWQSPQQVSSGFNSTYWWYDYPTTPAYQGDNTSRNCYVAQATGQPGAIVHDVYGAARQSFYVGWWPWDKWHGMGLNCGSCPNPAGTQVTGQGGPYSCLGMPITNLYRPTPSENYGRQDFQRGYIINGVIYCYDHITAFTPGWTINGWNNVWSYIITDAYDRYGAAAGLGHATQLVNTNWDGTGYFIQPYDGGIYGPIMLVYNPSGPSEAYGVSGSFLYAYTMGLDNSGVRLSTRIGSPTEDFSGNRQQFQLGYMTINYGTNVTYVYLNDNTEIWNSQTGGHLGKVAQSTLPSMFALNQNYPNPFNPVTTIAYTLPSVTHVTLEVFNILGQRVKILVDEEQSAGEYVVPWDASNNASGVYLYRLQTDVAIETKKMLLLK